MKLHPSIPKSPVAKICCAVFIAMLFTACTGCEVANIDDDGFGRIRSNSGYGAIDGISGFVHLLESRGLDVRQSSRISPVIERYNTIVWAPDRVLPPSKAAIKRLKTWVNDGYASRRLIFIGPGFRSRKLLDQKQIELAGDENLERAIRRYNEKLIRYPHPYHYRYVEEESCDWYDLTRIDNQPIKTITGPWSNSLSTGEPELYTGIYDFKIPSEIRPKNSPSTSPNSKRAVVLLSGDGHDLVYRIPAKKKFQNYGYYDGDGYEERIDETAGIFVVSNGSFIQNYGLVNPGNQLLANQLADQCAGDVLVLQSGPQPIQVTESLAPEKNGWAWLQKQPLRGIVPFFLLLATFTFFAVFPIHGRPKRIRLRPEKTFADHIRATGQLLKSSKGHDWAQKAIQKYNDNSPDKKSS